MLITGRPAPANGAVAISAVPASARASAAQPSGSARLPLFSVHSAPAKARNHTSTDRSTCATSATWKKSTSGNTSFTAGARDSTSNTESTPAAASDTSASSIQPIASVRRLSVGSGKK